MASNDKFDFKLAGVLELFRNWDADGSGTISFPELKVVLVDAGVPGDDVLNLVSLAHGIHDDHIDYEEFLTWLFTMAPEQVQLDMTMEVTINLLASDPFKVAVAKDATVQILKQQIRKYSGIAPNFQKLIFEEQLVQDDELLSECGINAGANVMLLVVEPCYHTVVFSPGKDHGCIVEWSRGDCPENLLSEIGVDSQAERAGVRPDMMLYRINGMESSKKLFKEVTRGSDDYEIVFTEVCNRVAWKGGGQCETCGFRAAWHMACKKTALQVGVYKECTTCGLWWDHHKACSRYQPDPEGCCKTCFLRGSEHVACSKFKAKVEDTSSCDTCGQWLEAHEACSEWEYNGKDVCSKCGICAERHNSVKACQEYRQGDSVLVYMHYQHRCRTCGVLSGEHNACKNWEYDCKLGCRNCGLTAQRHEDVQACGKCEYNPATKPGSCRHCGVLKACLKYEGYQKYDYPCERCGLQPFKHKACGRYEASAGCCCAICGLFEGRHDVCSKFTASPEDKVSCTNCGMNSVYHKAAGTS